jgi:hypothetical protein
MMLLLLAALAFAPGSSDASPAPAATPLKTIVRVRSSLLCTTLRDNLFHSIEGLRVNDQEIEQGRLMLGKMAYDSLTTGAVRRTSGTNASHAFEMDHYQLGQVAHSIAQNLEKVYALLDDPNRFPESPPSEDLRMLADAKKRLQDVADRQRVALNIINGTYETSALQMLLAAGDNTQGALGQVSVPDKTYDLENSTMGISSAQSNSTSTGTAAFSPVQMSLFANNAYGRLALGTLDQQRVTQTSESAVLQTILPIVNACR